MAALFNDCHHTITMMTSTPNSIFSWNSTLSGEGHRAELNFNLMSEQGSISLNGKYYSVNKHGIFRGKWTLSDQSRSLVSAKKLSAFMRTFTISSPTGTYTLEARSAMGRSMVLRGNRGQTTIAPDHIFTRRASLSGTLPDIETTCLAMWLTLLTWHRSRSSSNGGGGN
jgi:hypothetical protein